MVLTEVTRVWFDLDETDRNVIADVFTSAGAPAIGEWATGEWLEMIRTTRPVVWAAGCRVLIDSELPASAEREVTYEFDHTMP